MKWIWTGGCGSTTRCDGSGVAVDFGFVRQEVARCYGGNGQVSVDPEVILKLMCLLFLDNVKKPAVVRSLQVARKLPSCSSYSFRHGLLWLDSGAQRIQWQFARNARVSHG